MIKNDLSATISLDGTWNFSLGNKYAGGSIEVPGCWEAQGYSKFEEGPAYYQREVLIPESWVGHTILAEFEAVSYACDIVFNDVKVGDHQGMWTPFTVDLTKVARLGENNNFELTIYKPGERYPMRSSLAGFLPDVATTFGGVWQPCRLRALRFGLDDLHIDTDFDLHQLHIYCQADLFGNNLSKGDWEIEVFLGEELITSLRLTLTEDNKLDASLLIPDPILWSPTNPDLYTIQVSLLDNGTPVARTKQHTGFRRLSSDGDQLQFNGEPFMVRGILSWGWEPDLIAPAYTAELAREEMQRVRQLGFNLIKLCLFVPNQTYYEIADEEGMLLWQEWPMWQPEITPDLRERIPEEYADMTRLSRHHPSVVLYSLGCELDQAVDKNLLGEMDDTVRGLVTNVLVCDNSGSGESYEGLDYDFADFSDYHPYCDLHYFEPLLDNWRRDWKPPRSWIFGEFCDSDTFRDINEIKHANGGKRPWWLTADNPVTTWRSESKAMLEATDRLVDANPGFTPQEMTKTSYAQSMVERKYTLELLRRRAGMGGYIVTGLRDTPISTSGVWDDFYRAKWSPTEFRQVNDDAVLCLDVSRRRRWQNGGDRPDRLDAHNHWSGTTARWHVILNLMGAQISVGSQLRWTLVDHEGVEFGTGSSMIAQFLSPGKPCKLGVISCLLPDVERPAELQLEVSLSSDDLKISNSWPVWVYPRLPDPLPNLAIFDPAHCLDDWGGWLDQIPHLSSIEQNPSNDLILTTVWDAGLDKLTQNGGRVLLLQQGNGPLPVRRCPFWRESVLLFPEHPVWDMFPQQGYAGMQFFGMASDMAFVSGNLTDTLSMVDGILPIMRRLDAREFHLSEYIFEARIGEGLLLGCSLRLQGGAGAQPSGWENNVAGSSMLWALLNYLREV